MTTIKNALMNLTIFLSVFWVNALVMVVILLPFVAVNGLLYGVGVMGFSWFVWLYITLGLATLSTLIMVLFGSID